MKKKLLILCLFFCQFSLGQNLVPNPSFEDTLQCPNGGGEIDYAIGWSSYGHTPDYFNSCDTGFENIPSNYAGFQYAHFGNGYAGLICYYTPVSNLREYIGIQLSQPLNVGQTYFASFYVSMAFKHSVRFGIAINNIGLKLSTVSFTSSNTVPINNILQSFLIQ